MYSYMPFYISNFFKRHGTVALKWITLNCLQISSNTRSKQKNLFIFHSFLVFFFTSQLNTGTVHIILSKRRTEGIRMVGWRHVWVLSPEWVCVCICYREPGKTSLKKERGPFSSPHVNVQATLSGCVCSDVLISPAPPPSRKGGSLWPPLSPYL